ncbi:beta-galactosidase GalB [Cellvibrio japonicus]|uniref:Beta-galactosidase, putative, bgl2B n=1 Tax=Cellvibrio japonicus (strain Ueda107) TaxID=498211 RepID=B3PJ21_CELJU|nr:beta-galactosidase GalB [Cellvibrio japonicus]ACE85150.1 beta-galactosidase, putative, bgl2B [Cellvibrio japonicus Ueda107]
MQLFSRSAGDTAGSLSYSHCWLILVLVLGLMLGACSDRPGDAAQASQAADTSPRERILLNSGWRFMKYPEGKSDALIYDVRPEVINENDAKDADSKPTEAVSVERNQQVLKPWILPSANPFIADPAKHHTRPQGNPGGDFPLVQADFDDSQWQMVNLPHDWAIAGPFYEGEPALVGGGMGRLPSPGVAWYRKTLNIPASDVGKRLFLDVEGAMSYAMVWVNGQLAGGWPYGYNSWRLDLTPYMKAGADNQIAIRLDNPNHSARWYPGGGLYRNVWLTKTQAVHVAQWGTRVTTPEVSSASARIAVDVTVDNQSLRDVTLVTTTHIYALNTRGEREGESLGQVITGPQTLAAGSSALLSGELRLANPRLWGPLPQQVPNLYLAHTSVYVGEQLVDTYDTRFGIRQLEFHPTRGVLVNGEAIYLQGVNQHHDLGALGAAFNRRAAERQLEILREMGVNAIRLAHNPPAPELLELTDAMGFLVVNEIYDSWERKKTAHDFHLIFPDWYEADLRSLIRRDRNHPSVIMWSVGNEVGEQYTDEAGAVIARRLHDIVKEEDSTRPTAASFNYAKPQMPITAVMDTISLNYQGEGIRNAPAYSHLQGIRTEPLYPAFHAAFPDKAIFSSENAAAVSSRGEYLFPVVDGISAPVADGAGGDPVRHQVSAYELYTAPFGSSADKVLGSLARHPYVAGGFIWSGWDYLGEPTPYYAARSSYFGVIDLAGFKKDRFYLYQAAWRPELPMVHILPHWNWPGREGQVTPVHLFTSGDEAELFLNGQSLGRKQKGEYEYRLRWDEVLYQPGELKSVAYKDGKPWAEQRVQTTGPAAAIKLEADRAQIGSAGVDLSFITASIRDENGLLNPLAMNELRFSLEGPGEIVATDNGDPTSFVPFVSHQRPAFHGLALVIVRATGPGKITLKATSDGLAAGELVVQATP